MPPILAGCCMSVLVVGINHNSASVALRERVSIAPAQMTEALGSLSAAMGGADAVILSTCNRTELYLAAEAGLHAHAVFHWLAGFHQLSADELRHCYYSHDSEIAVRHLMPVSCGLDSLVLGEPQIFGQMKSAVAQAGQSGHFEWFAASNFPTSICRFQARAF